MDIKKRYSVQSNGQGIPPHIAQYLSAAGTRTASLGGGGGGFNKVGCMDKKASNYDSTATKPCADCCIMTGTLDGDPDSTTDGGSGTSTPKVVCKDPKASNYDATFGSPCESCCVYPKHGCMDSDALNYDSTASVACDYCCKYPDTTLLATDVVDGGVGGYGGGGFGGGDIGGEGEGGAPIKKKSKLPKIILLCTLAYVGYRMIKK